MCLSFVISKKVMLISNYSNNTKYRISIRTSVAHWSVVCSYVYVISVRQLPTSTKNCIRKILSQKHLFVSEDSLVLLKLKYLIKINFMNSPRT